MDKKHDNRRSYELRLCGTNADVEYDPTRKTIKRIITSWLGGGADSS
jgi:hypothetical protein